MSGQYVAVGEACVTHITDVGSLSCVSPQVISQLGGLGKLLITLLIFTLVGTLIAMDRFNVLIEALGYDLLVANVTRNHGVGDLLTMNNLRMSSVLCLPAKYFGTFRTFKAFTCF